VSERAPGPGFADRVLRVLDDAALPYPALILELSTPTLVAMRPAGEIELLRRHGVRVAVDDVTAATTSLAGLRGLPLDLVKVDASLICPPTSRDWPLGATFLPTVEAMGLVAVATGVGSRHTADVVRALGCPLAQGVGLHRRGTRDELDDLLLDARP